MAGVGNIQSSYSSHDVERERYQHHNESHRQILPQHKQLSENGRVIGAAIPDTTKIRVQSELPNSEVGDNSKKQLPQKKRPLACINCRYSKLKCQFSSTEEPRTCDRCKLQGTACKVEGRSEERQHFEEFSHRLGKVEGLLNALIGKIEVSLLTPDQTVNSGNNFHSHNHTSNGGNSGTIGISIPQSPASSITTSGISSPVTLKQSNGTSINAIIWRKRDRRPGGTAKELLSEINSEASSGRVEYNEDDPESTTLQTKRAKLSPDILGRDLIDRGLINTSEADECLMFFSTNVARYLPVLVLDYVGYFDSSIRQRSPLLFASVLAVSSLYHPNYRERHKAFRKELESLAEKVDRPRVELWDLSNSSHHDVQLVLDDILALIIAGAWIGGELGFRASLVASEMFGYLLPPNPQNFRYIEPTRSTLGAIGLATYIIEKRLRIIHDRPSQLPPDALSNRRDLYLPIFLSVLSGSIKNFRSLDPSELKATANVELCALMMMYQQELSDKLEATVMTHWNTQLDKWLTEWMGKLTVHLKPSSWKPLMLTFHYAKLFLNLRVIQDTNTYISSVSCSTETTVNSSEPSMKRDSSSENNNIDSTANLLESGFIRFVTLAEKSALDVLDMLVFDEDIQRMVRVAPVFYPTIFVTAGAFLLKLLCVGPSIQYQTNEKTLISAVALATARLEDSIASDILPCYRTVRNLGDALAKVVKILQSTGRYSPEEFVRPTSFEDSSLISKINGSQQMTQDPKISVPLPTDMSEKSLPIESAHTVGDDQIRKETANLDSGSQLIPFNSNYQWSFVPANSQQFMVPTIVPLPVASQEQPRLVPEGMTPLLHPQPIPLPTAPTGSQWPLNGEGFRQVYGSDTSFLMDAHSTNLLQSLFDSQYMTSS